MRGRTASREGPLARLTRQAWQTYISPMLEGAHYSLDGSACLQGAARLLCIAQACEHPVRQNDGVCVCVVFISRIPRNESYRECFLTRSGARPHSHTY